MAALQLVQPHSTQDERLDVLGKEAQEQVALDKINNRLDRIERRLSLAEEA
jgi:hypothetical protein